MPIISRENDYVSPGCFYGCIPGGISEGCKNCTAKDSGGFQIHRKYRPLTLCHRTILNDVFIDGKIKGSVEWSGRYVFVFEKLERFLRRKKASRFLFTSMGEPALMTHEEWKQVFEIIAKYPHHHVIFVTKLPREILNKTRGLVYPNNISIAVSVESEKYTHRIETLWEFPIPKENKEVWFKPLLGPITHDLGDVGSIEVSEERASRGRKRNTAPEWINNLLNAAKASNVTVVQHKEN
jgi:protein gp37